MGLPEKLESTGVDIGVDTSVGAPRLTLTGRQMALLQALIEKSEEAGFFYSGALRVFADEDNPARIPLAAHGIRELMDKLPALLDAPAQVREERLGDKFNAMKNVWKTGRRNSQCHEDGSWSGCIDDHLRRALEAVDETIAWHATNRPRRRDVAADLLRRLDASGRRLPVFVENSHSDRWVALFRYFTGVLHRGCSADAVEFADRLHAFEQFVLDRLRPRTSEEMATLDVLIAEAEHSA